ncbi:glutathione peroxidase [Novosphingobium sp.]|uniref:glutathione peroxidase n=1 Tax=Novosphingobium sp. TaxID=1874826 RepID=UPI003D0A1622
MTALTDIGVNTIAGQPTSLGDYAGKVLLVVNVASKCGLTPQYEGLEKLQAEFGDQGFSVLGFPANDFGAQEPGTNAEIAEFCSATFRVSFPMHEKIVVTGADKHPLYAALTQAAPEQQGDAEGFRERLRGYGMTPNEAPEVLWNFEKFVIAKDGTVAARFAPTTAPDDAALTETIAAELKK